MTGAWMGAGKPAPEHGTSGIVRFIIAPQASNFAGNYFRELKRPE
jgi:hypothetical protein